MKRLLLATLIALASVLPAAAQEFVKQDFTAHMIGEFRFVMKDLGALSEIRGSILDGNPRVAIRLIGEDRLYPLEAGTLVQVKGTCGQIALVKILDGHWSGKVGSTFISWTKMGSNHP